MSHVSFALLSHFMDDEVTEPERARVREHLEQCGRCAETLRELRSMRRRTRDSLRAQLKMGTLRTPACVDDSGLYGYVTDTLPPREREAVLAHMSRCLYCHQRLTAPHGQLGIGALEEEDSRAPRAETRLGGASRIVDFSTLSSHRESPVTSGGSSRGRRRSSWATGRSRRRLALLIQPDSGFHLPDLAAGGFALVTALLCSTDWNAQSYAPIVSSKAKIGALEALGRVRRVRGPDVRDEHATILLPERHLLPERVAVFEPSGVQLLNDGLMQVKWQFGMDDFDQFMFLEFFRGIGELLGTDVEFRRRPRAADQAAL